MQTVTLNINQRLVTIWESDSKYEDYKYFGIPTMADKRFYYGNQLIYFIDFAKNFVGRPLELQSKDRSDKFTY